MSEIYIVRGSAPHKAMVEIYELDHETEKMLFLKQYGGVIQRAKAGLHYFSDMGEAEKFLAEWRVDMIRKLKDELADVEALTSIRTRRVPVTRDEVSESEIEFD